MAQFYKMTLYVCDVEDSTNIENIKMLIDERALNGISVNCITHYDNEQIGENIDWNDDVDVNFLNSTTEQWEKYFKH